MAERSAIEWTGATFNPWTGCDQVSPGCAHCYADSWARRTGRGPFFGALRRTSVSTWRAPRRWTEGRLVFTCSLSDFFHPDADPWRAEAWAVIRETPQHLYQILTKRPERIGAQWPTLGWPSNAWLGVSVENARWLEPRVRYLSSYRFAVPGTFVSAEPLLGPLDLRPWLAVEAPGLPRSVQWVLVGGESGPKARPMRLAWARDLVQQCRAAGVPVLVKQLGGHPDKRGGAKATLDGALVREFPAAMHSYVN